MLKDKEDRTIANNLGFCKLLLGKYEEGSKYTERALLNKYDPLFEMNEEMRHLRSYSTHWNG